MPRIPTTNEQTTSAPSAELLAGVKATLGMVPNLYATLAHSPAALKFALTGSEILGQTSLSSKLREQIAIAVATANTCEYCLAAHTAIGKSLGLSDQQTQAAQQATADPDAPEDQAALNLAIAIIQSEGFATDDDLQSARNAGLSDQQIVEITTVVAYNIFTNYFNHVAQPDIDFPKVALPAEVA